jgi:hypothetical protein
LLAYEGVSIISGTGAAISPAVVVVGSECIQFYAVGGLADFYVLFGVVYLA